MDSQLKRGILNICILQLLKQEDRYGYDIIKILQGLFPDTDESTIYAILRRLNKGGLTEVYYSEKSLGPQRKYYKIVEKGELYLKENKKLIENLNWFLQINQLIQQKYIN